MKIDKSGFKNPIPDNDARYLEFITDALKHSDPEAELKIHKVDKEIKVNIMPSAPEFRQSIITNLLDAHRLFKIKIIFSKSLAIEKHINFITEW